MKIIELVVIAAACYSVVGFVMGFIIGIFNPLKVQLVVASLWPFILGSKRIHKWYLEFRYRALVQRLDAQDAEK